MLILCLILIRLSVNMTCFCPCCYSCYCCSCCSDDSLLHAGIRPLVQGDRKRMICMAHTMLLEKPSPIKHPVECLARGICSARLISPVEMVLPFFSHVSVTSGLKGTLNIYSLLIYFFFLSFFLFFFLKKAFWKAFKRSMLLCKELHAYVNKLLVTKPVLFIRDSKSIVNYQNCGLCIWGFLRH